jgi:N-acetylmuramic acid 6-phosphate etherase
VDAAATAIDERSVTDKDVVVGIAASGTTPFVRAAVKRAQALGAKTALVTCTDPPTELDATCDAVIVARVGPEALTGSTRLKAGTATKLALNMITTGAMIRLGKAYGNLMVDLMALSDKLRDRGERIVMEVGGVDRAAARDAIAAAGGSVKLALVMVRAGLNAKEASWRLRQAGGIVRSVVGDPPPVLP